MGRGGLSFSFENVFHEVSQSQVDLKIVETNLEIGLS